MSENVENLILEHLRALRGDLQGVKQDTEWIRSRMTAIETSVARIARDQAHEFEERISLMHNVDRMMERIETIERRLEIKS